MRCTLPPPPACTSGFVGPLGLFAEAEVLATITCLNTVSIRGELTLYRVIVPIGRTPFTVAGDGTIEAATGPCLSGTFTYLATLHYAAEGPGGVRGFTNFASQRFHC